MVFLLVLSWPAASRIRERNSLRGGQEFFSYAIPLIFLIDKLKASKVERPKTSIRLAGVDHTRADCSGIFRILGFQRKRRFFFAPIPAHLLFLSVQSSTFSRCRIFGRSLNLHCKSSGHNRGRNDRRLCPRQKIQSPHTICKSLDKTYRVSGLPFKSPPLNENKKTSGKFSVAIGRIS